MHLSPGYALSLSVAQVVAIAAFTAGEVRDPRRDIPRSLVIGTGLVMGLCLLVNLTYFTTLPVPDIQQVPSDRVAAASLEMALPGIGAALLAAAIMVSTFGCANGMLLAGARAYYAMARDGLFFRSVGTLNAQAVPGWGLVVQPGGGGTVDQLARPFT